MQKHQLISIKDYVVNSNFNVDKKNNEIILHENLKYLKKKIVK